MKTKFINLLVVVVTILLSSSASQKGIEKCYLSFTKSVGFKTSGPIQVENSEKNERLETEEGEVTIANVDGYNLEYSNNKKSVAVEVRVRLLNSATYQTDKELILSHVKHLHTQAAAFSDSQELAELSFNGFTIYGSRTNTIDLDSRYKFLGAYVFFPEKDMAVFIYFHNNDSKSRFYEDVSDLHSTINGFIGGYTGHLQNCLNK